MTPEELAERLEKAAARAPAAIDMTLRHEGALLRSLIQAHASGRPGPNIVTGRYHASWRVVAERIAGGAQVTVGTEAPQGPRLEFGFVGTDARGRTVDQAPLPHVGPAVEEFGRRVPLVMKRALGEAIGG